MNFVGEANVTMAVPNTVDRGVKLRVSTGDPPSIRNGLNSERIVSVLLETGLEEWRRGWQQSPGPTPAREAIIAASEPTRGATASTQVVSDRRLVYTVLDTPVDVEQLLASITEYLTGVETADVQLLVDNIAPLAADQGVPAVERLISKIQEFLAESVTDIVIGCSVGSDTDPTLASIFGSLDRVEGGNLMTADQIDRLRQTDPTTFGYLRRHWSEAQRGLKACNRSYPQSKQVHATLSDPETTPRTLGATLSGLVELGALDMWNETVGPTRYDLTAYRPERVWDIGICFASSSSDQLNETPTNDK